MLERLDRAVATKEWQDIFPNVQVTHLPRYKSDHAPIVINCAGMENDETRVRRSPRFRFEHIWLHHPQFQNILKQQWQDTWGCDNLVGQLKRCNEGLSRWASHEFGNIRKMKKELYEKLVELQKSQH